MLYSYRQGSRPYSCSIQFDLAGLYGEVQKLQRQKQISEFQKQIGTYSKTREIYSQYLKSGRSEKFYEEHRADITLHQAARNHFNKLGYDKKNPLPKINVLQKEWATLNSEKKNLYSGNQSLSCKDLNAQCKELLTAKSNCEWLLGINRKAPAQISERKEISHER